MSRLDEIDLNQDLVFTGPITQEELIITWRKRRQERLERERSEAEARKLEESNTNRNDSSEMSKESEEVADRSESDRIPEPDPVAPSAEEQVTESVQPVQLPPKPTSNILRPARLNVDSASFTSDWAKRINMKKVENPKRPEYVQPLE